nr:glycosyltransferase [Photobacterium phosphoreum]
MTKRRFSCCCYGANALGIPVLCYDVPGCIDSVVDGVNGFIYKYGDYSSMCEKIIYLSSLNKNSFEELSQSSLQLAKDEFDANDKSKTFIKYIVGE